MVERSTVALHGLLTRLAALVVALLIVMPSAAYAQQDEESQGGGGQDASASLISVPFQNHTDFNAGNTNNAQNVLNIHPVIPLSLGDNCNMITRPVLPVIYQPSLDLPGAEDSEF